MTVQLTSTKGFGISSLTALVHGPSGSGKTYAARTCPGKTLVVSAEAGLLSLRDVSLDVALVKAFKDLQQVYVMLLDNEAGYEWVYIDSLSEVAEICLAEEMTKTAHGVKAYGEMQTKVMRMVKAFRNLPLNVVFSAKQGSDVDPEGVAYLAAELPEHQGPLPARPRARPDHPQGRQRGHPPILPDDGSQRGPRQGPLWSTRHLRAA